MGIPTKFLLPHFQAFHPTPEFFKKYPSSFRRYGKNLIMFVLRAEGYFRYPSAVLQFVLSRMIKSLAQNDKKFGAERFVVLSHEGELKDDSFILQSVICCMIMFYHIT